MADWKFRGLDTNLTDEATVFNFRFVRPGTIEEPAIEADLTEEVVHQQIRAVCQRILGRASEDLERLATLKTLEMALVGRRMDAKEAAAAQGEAAQ